MFKVDKNFSQPNIPRTIRFTEKIFEELSTIADEENIPFNLLVLQCCRYALDNYAKD